MIRLDWANPKVTIQQFEELLQINLDSDLDGLLFENDYLYVVPTSIFTQEQESFIYSTYYGLNDIGAPVKVMESSATEIDTEGRQITRIAAGKKGWSYYALGVELETSKLDSLYCKDVSENNISGSSIKFYNAAGTELTTQESIDTDCVRTVIVIAPSYDYEVISGNIRQIAAPATNVRMWVQAGILELGGVYVKSFADGLNMRFMGTSPAETDGRASKYMTKDIPGVPYQANQFKFTFRHDAGVKHPMFITIETFRA